MPRFEELAAAPRVTSDPGRLLAKRYILRRKLGRGGFGTVFLVRDTKARDGEPLKVLKEIPVGDLKPDETVPATVEAQLLAQLRHPAILRFHTSFLERDAFCIITEYCEDGDLDCKIEELRQAGRTLPESQVVEWFIQLLLGVHYMHERRILHRDLKAKNVFVKKSVLKIGDFGVSRLLVGSCDLATTFIGTPHYMSPEVLTQQGYDAKCDIWSLGCILYEMCCLERAFGGRSFLSVVTSIVEGPTPSLPQPFAQELCSVVQRMLSKDPASRPSAEELLKVRFLQDKMQDMRLKLCDGAVKEETVMSERHAAQIKKVHLETLRQRSEVQKMSPRERMRLRKLQAADDNARELKCLAEEKYAENCRRTRELRWQHFQRLSVDLLSGNAEAAAPRTRPIAAQDSPSLGRPELLDGQEPERPSVSELTDSRIPEDAQTAEAYYNGEGFESCSDEEQTEEEEEEEGSLADEEPSDTLCGASGQDSDVEAMMKYMENILENTSSGCRMVLESNLQGPLGPPTVNYTMVETRVERMRQFVREKLGAEVFQRAYDYLKEARRRQESEAQVWVVLGGLVERPGDCFHVDQLLYYEEQLGGACGPHA